MSSTTADRGRGRTGGPGRGGLPTSGTESDWEGIDVWDFLGHGIYLLFQHGPSADGPECRALGPYQMVRFGVGGVWAYGPLGEAPVRVATRAPNGPYWEIDGLDDWQWADVTLLAPARPTSAREIEASNQWVRTR